MMKVIRHGKNYIRYGKCDCGCEFKYDRKDTKAYKKEFDLYNCNLTVERKATKKELKDNDLIFYVTCPECGNRVFVDREI